MSGSEKLKGRVKVLPTTVRVDGIEIIDFVPNLPKIFKRLPDLGAMRGSSLNFSFQNVSISITWQSKESFNISCNVPESLDTLVTVLRTLYDEK